MANDDTKHVLTAIKDSRDQQDKHSLRLEALFTDLAGDIRNVVSNQTRGLALVEQAVSDSKAREAVYMAGAKNGKGNGEHWRLILGLMVTLMIGFVTPLFILQKGTNDNVERMLAAMAGDNERERIDAGPISMIQPLAARVNVLDEWRVEHKAESAAINARQQETIKLHRHDADGRPAL
jgi:hypothetical protein